MPVFCFGLSPKEKKKKKHYITSNNTYVANNRVIQRDTILARRAKRHMERTWIHSRHYIQVEKVSTAATINKIDKKVGRNRGDLKRHLLILTAQEETDGVIQVE